jgi:hypothetical protein
MSAMGSAKVPVALLTFAFCLKSAILHYHAWAFGLNSTLSDGGLGFAERVITKILNKILTTKLFLFSIFWYRLHL